MTTITQRDKAALLNATRSSVQVTCEKVYRIVDGNNAYMVRFVKNTADSIPGYSHKVLILKWGTSGQLDLLNSDWLSVKFRPSKETAIFFWSKYILSTNLLSP